MFVLQMGDNPIHMAARSGKLEIIQQMKIANADLGQRNVVKHSYSLCCLGKSGAGSVHCSELVTSSNGHDLDLRTNETNQTYS